MNHESLSDLIYEQVKLPIFQNRMFDTEEEAKACPTGDIRLVEDQRTGLIYNSAFHPQVMAYDTNYQNEQSLSLLFQQHLESISQIIYKFIGRESIIEIGCGKGFFLEMLLKKGFDITGYDPAYEGNNPRVMKQTFKFGVEAKANGLVLRHVLEHIQDPFNFLVELKKNNGGSGKIYIEVPCFDWICKHRAWYDIYYEHVNYFRISDFYRMFDNVIESGLLFGGQYLYIVAELSTIREPELDMSDRVIFPEDFTQNLLIAEQNDTAVWGGASKGVIFTLLKERVGQPISMVIDINPAKQGKYLPATGLLVQSPSEAIDKLPRGSTIYIMNPNYSEEIRQMSNNLFNYIVI